MIKNSYKFLFFISLLMGSLITICANSWLSIWMGLEINLLSFIPLMINSKNLFSSESALKYFLTQAFASSVLMFSILLIFVFLNYNMNFFYFLPILISSSLMLKVGAAPFHFWFPSVMEGLSWMNCLILMTVQKLAPLMIFSYLMDLNFLIFIIFMSTLFGSLGGLNQTSLRKLMAFSSINHMGWMIAGTMSNDLIWMIYFLFYSFLSTSIVMMFYNFKLMNMNQTFLMNDSNMFMKSCLFCMLLSMGGLPPFIGFFPKWMIIETLTTNNMFFILLIMIFLTLITLFFYIRISYSAFLINFLKMNWKFKYNFLQKNMKLMLLLTFFSLFGLIFINFIYLII